MHGHDSLSGEEKIHERENPFLHLPAVPRTADYGGLLLQVEPNKDLAVQPVLLVVGVRHLARVDDSEIGDKVLNLLAGLRADEHVGHEVVLPRDLRDKAYFDTRGGVRSSIAVKDIHLLGIVVVHDHLGVELGEDCWLHGLIDLPPPDLY